MLAISLALHVCMCLYALCQSLCPSTTLIMLKIAELSHFVHCNWPDIVSYCICNRSVLYCIYRQAAGLQVGLLCQAFCWSPGHMCSMETLTRWSSCRHAPHIQLSCLICLSVCLCLSLDWLAPQLSFAFLSALKSDLSLTSLLSCLRFGAAHQLHACLLLDFLHYFLCPTHAQLYS